MQDKERELQQQLMQARPIILSFRNFFFSRTCPSLTSFSSKYPSCIQFSASFLRIILIHTHACSLIPPLNFASQARAALESMDKKSLSEAQSLHSFEAKELER
jgi:hypothetical protein